MLPDFPDPETLTARESQVTPPLAFICECVWDAVCSHPTTARAVDYGNKADHLLRQSGSQTDIPA
jgi:hypothetical protein